MKAVVLEKPSVVVMNEVPVPVPQPGFARVKVAAAAVCATSKKRLGIAEEMGAYATIATSECETRKKK